MDIHPTAIVSPDAEVDSDVIIGPFSVVEPNVRIASGCRLAARVTVRSGVRLGAENEVCEGAVLGGAPQHLAPPGPPGRVEIGAGNTIRENATIHRALNEDAATRIGDACMLMVGAHVAHDCEIGSGAVLTNNVMLAGHVTIGARAYVGGGAAVHQFCRVGRLAMVGGMARVTQDIPPFVTIDGGSNLVVGLNRVGLRRAGIDRRQIAELKEAYRVIYRSGESLEERLNLLTERFAEGPASEYVEFLLGGKRGFVRARRSPPGGTIRVFHEALDEAA